MLVTKNTFSKIDCSFSPFLNRILKHPDLDKGVEFWYLVELYNPTIYDFGNILRNSDFIKIGDFWNWFISTKPNASEVRWCIYKFPELQNQKS